MSAKLEKDAEDIQIEEAEHRQELGPAAKTVYSRLPRVGANIKMNRIHGLFNEPEYTVWDVYNNEARKVDTVLVNDWKESLNSLLLFAAIFAAVLAAFIIESKKMLEQDWTGILVNATIFSIQNAGNLSNVPYIPPEFNATPTAISINCLLFASLGASLVAALLSVVALQWVVDYDAAITRGGSSPEDRAKRRQFRYAGVLSWKMGEIIASLPLLLYSSVALFWAGAVQWMWTIHPTVGYILAGGSAITALIYAGTTLLAATYVSAPFRTPLSRGIYWLFQPSLSLVLKFLSKIPLGGNPPRLGIPPKMTSRSSHERLAGSAFCHHVVQITKWIQANLLPHATGSQREERAANVDDSLGEQAMCWLGGQLPLSADSQERLLLLLRELLSHPPKQSLSSGASAKPLWPIFDFLGWHYLRKVLNGTLSEDDQEGLGLLLRCSEVPEINSMITAEKYQPASPSATYRTQYGLGITKTRGKPTVNATLLLARDEKGTLLRTFANSPHLDVQTAAASALRKWGQNAEPRDAIWATIPSLIELLKDRDDSVRSATASALGEFAAQAELCDGLRVAIQPLLERFKDQHSGVRCAAASALGKFAEQAELCESLRVAIHPLLERLKDQHSGVRCAAASALGKFAEKADLCDVLHAAIQPLIELLKDEEVQARRGAASALGKFAEQAELRDTIRDAIPSLIKLLKDAQWEARRGAASALGKFAAQAELRGGLHVAIQPLLECSKDRFTYVKSAAAAALGNFAEEVELCDVICDAVLPLTELLEDAQWQTRYHAASALGKFAEQSELRDGLHVSVQPLFDSLKDKDSDVRSAAASALGKFAEEAELRGAIRDAIPSLIEMLKDAQWEARHGAASALGKFAQQAELIDTVYNAIPPLIELLKDAQRDARRGAACALGKFAAQAEFCDGLHVAIQPLLGRFNDRDSDVRSAAASALGKFAEQAELRGGLRVAIQPLVKLLKDEESSVRSTTASALGKFAEQMELRDVVRGTIPSFIELLKDAQWEARHGAASALGKFAEQVELRDAIYVAIQPLLGRFEDDYSPVRHAAASALGNFAKQAELRDALRDAIRGAIPCIIEQLTDTQWRARVIAVSALGGLAGVL